MGWCLQHGISAAQQPYQSTQSQPESRRDITEDTRRLGVYIKRNTDSTSYMFGPLIQQEWVSVYPNF